MSEAGMGIPSGFEPGRFSKGFLGHIGPIYEKRDSKAAVLGLLAESRHINPAGLVHGGVYATLLDVAIAHNAALQTGGGFFVTQGLDCHYLAPAYLGEWIETEVEVTKVGKNAAYGLGRVVCDGRILVTASAIYLRWNKPLPGAPDDPNASAAG